MKLSSILTPERTQWGVQASSKKRVLEDIALFISEDIAALDANELFTQLLAREKLGSTGLGHGVAIPHCRAPNCSTIVGALIALEQAIDFEAVDDQPVDLLFALIVPEEAHDEHIQVLASIAELFGREAFRQQLRDCHSSQELYETLVAADTD